MKIHKEGRKIIIWQAILLLSLSLIANYTDFNQTLERVILVITFLTLIMTIYFFRKPSRIFSYDEKMIYAPCDGKVVVIEKTTEKEFFKDKRIQVSIFMSPLNIHNNLNPISGKIKYKKYHPGKFLFAWQPKASADNERCTIVIENKRNTVLLRQIAGALARRIITYPSIGDMVKVNNEIGFIKFGSRVDLFLHPSTQIKVKLNDKVKGGQTIIASN